MNRALQQTASPHTGSPIDPATREFMEARLGHNFGHVRVHADSVAAESAGALGAEAYTVGQHILFAGGALAPHSTAGRELLAHELVHVAQQSAGAAKTSRGISDPHDAAEREASQVAKQVVRSPGPVFPARLSAPVTSLIHREPKPGPKADENAPTAAEIQKATDEEAARTNARKSAARGKYDGIAKEKLEKAPADFSRLEKDNEHKEVPAANTPLTQEAVIAALKRSWQRVFGNPISPKALSLLIGQWHTEGGGAGIFNYNIGNLQMPLDEKKKLKDPASNYSMRTAPETKQGKDENKRSPFASFQDIDQGAMALIHHIVSGRPALWAALESGNVEDYVYVLKSYNYFTAPVEDIRVRGKVIRAGYLTATRQNALKLDKLVEAAVKEPTKEPAKDAGAPSVAAEPPKPVNPGCETACKAIVSMRNSVTHLCGLTGEKDEKCISARAKLKGAEDRVHECGC